MWHKNEVFHYFKKFKHLVENKSGYKIKKLKSDNGKEYVNKEMENYLDECGIRLQLMAPYTPE